MGNIYCLFCHLNMKALEVLANIYPVSLYVINFSCKSVHNTLNLIRCL